MGALVTAALVVRERSTGVELARSTFATRPEAEAYLGRKVPGEVVAEFDVSVEEEA